MRITNSFTKTNDWMKTNDTPSLAWDNIINLNIHRLRATTHPHFSFSTAICLNLTWTIFAHYPCSITSSRCTTCSALCPFLFCLVFGFLLFGCLSGANCFPKHVWRRLLLRRYGPLFTYWYLHLTSLASHLPLRFNLPISVSPRSESSVSLLQHCSIPRRKEPG